MADVTRYESCFTLLRVAALCAVLVSGIRPADAQWLSREDAIMGTAIRVELWTDDAAAGEAAIDAVIDEMRRIDREMSPFKPESELSRINQARPGEASLGVRPPFTHSTWTRPRGVSRIRGFPYPVGRGNLIAGKLDSDRDGRL